jgi:hypothetical protein
MDSSSNLSLERIGEQPAIMKQLCRLELKLRNQPTRFSARLTLSFALGFKWQAVGYAAISQIHQSTSSNVLI